MTTSFITDQIDQELQLTDLQNLNGGSPAIFGIGMIAGIGGGITLNFLVEELTGKGIVDHVADAVESSLKPDQCEVAPTGDGKGCTDRDWPV